MNNSELCSIFDRDSEKSPWLNNLSQSSSVIMHRNSRVDSAVVPEIYLFKPRTRKNLFCHARYPIRIKGLRQRDKNKQGSPPPPYCGSQPSVGGRKKTCYVNRIETNGSSARPSLGCRSEKQRTSFRFESDCHSAGSISGKVFLFPENYFRLNDNYWV